MTQILSAIKGFGEEGYTANRTARSQSRNQGRAEYFVVPVGHQGRAAHLAPGIYQRKAPSARSGNARYKSRGIRPVLLFVPLPRYTRQFDFPKLVRKEALRRFRYHFPRALAQAVGTAKRRR